MAIEKMNKITVFLLSKCLNISYSTLFFKKFGKFGTQNNPPLNTILRDNPKSNDTTRGPIP